jgi:hypothetical protein
MASPVLFRRWQALVGQALWFAALGLKQQVKGTCHKDPEHWRRRLLQPGLPKLWLQQGSAVSQIQMPQLLCPYI